MSSRLDVISDADWEALARKGGFKVGALAQRVGVSSECLRIYVRVRFHVPTKDWLAKLRLREAPKYLGEGQFVKEVAKILNFHEPTHFSRAFRRAHGCSPLAFATAAMLKSHAKSGKSG